MYLPLSEAFSGSFSFSMTSMFARAAAAETGLPPKVERWSPGSKESPMSALVVHALMGKPFAIPFAIVIRSGSTP